jgi:hypothetical protein
LGSGLRAQGSGFRVQGSGFGVRVQDLELKVQGLGFRVQGKRGGHLVVAPQHIVETGLGFRIWSPGFVVYA